MKKRSWNKGKAYQALINTTRWRRLRLAYLSANPLCVRCLDAGRSTPATVVHHIKPLEDYIASPSIMEHLAYEPSNLQALCTACHHLVHVELDSRGVEANRHRKQELLKSFAEQWLDRSEHKAPPLGE